MKNRNIIAAVILLIGLTLLVVGGNNSVINQRMNPATNLQESRLQSQSTDNLETLSEPLSELKTETTLPAYDENSQVVEEGDRVTVHYRGWLAGTGVIFDESFKRNQPFTFTVGEGVIEGWSQGVVGMKAGEIRRLKIPSSLGYGDADMGTIPPNSDLIFDVELMKIN